MKKNKVILFLTALFVLCNQGHTNAQQGIRGYLLGEYAISASWVNSHLTLLDYTTLQRETTELLTSKVLLNANNMLIAKTWDSTLVNYQIYIINNIINSARLSSGMYGNNGNPDDYLGWMEFADGIEKPLYESSPLGYIVQFLYMLQENGWKDKLPENKIWWERVLNFVEIHEWKKWGERSYYKYAHYIRKRNYMGANWAIVALYLKKLSSNQELITQYNEVLDIYNTLLKRNLKPNPNHPDAYIWNSSWDDLSGIWVQGITPDTVDLQDVAHANSIINYIIAAYETGEADWTIVDIQRMCNTAKNVIYDPVTNNFVRNIDGTDIDLNNGSSAFGNVGDGWVKLSKYDPGVKAVMKEFVKNKDKYPYLYQPILFAAYFYGE
ncbi:MAG: hypothetical protein KDC31_13815 [Saprospiraceae bacterium]|mgnify:CR=1 FL=1|jgi:hypothetical protein|nr:hypothetical protein [Saprospiraceae bacterium]MBX7178838.1 hypothetical protein [Saprospiraceae bacterium]MCB0592370.1 hypothetical protein [Saprospiraceae bacterium]MCO5282163.1 hypothetical protein [Saprospiraceae bacterium]MCO6472006.1 hypothetical protein [Saprospiraceae bacterium]